MERKDELLEKKKEKRNLDYLKKNGNGKERWTT
jgi:hypothetical protein